MWGPLGPHMCVSPSASSSSYGAGMAGTREPNNRSASTTWEWRKVRMSRPPDGQERRPAAGRSFSRLPWKNPRDVLTVKVRYRGGAEAWIEVHARGVTKRYPGSLSLFDVMADVWQWDRKPRG